MDYKTIRPYIKSGHLLAWSHRAQWWASWHDFKISMVRVFTKSEYSHVGIAWVVGDRVLVFEAVTPIVRIHPLSSLGDFYHIPIRGRFGYEALSFAMSCVGKNYSELQASQAPFMELKEDEKWECAELCIAIAKRMGTDLGRIATPTEVVRTAMLNGAPCSLISNPPRKDL
jgi:hypothetical protein